MDDALPLAADEPILWQGRPAPRGYTFRNWRHALFGFVLTIPCLIWLLAGIEIAGAGGPAWAAWAPLPFALGSLYLAFGQIFLARLEWERVYYAVTDRTLYLRCGLFRPRLRTLPRSAVTQVRQKNLGPNLATIRFDGQDGEVLIFCAIEYPEQLRQFFPAPDPAP